MAPSDSSRYLKEHPELTSKTPGLAGACLTMRPWLRVCVFCLVIRRGCEKPLTLPLLSGDPLARIPESEAPRLRQDTRSQKSKLLEKEPYYRQPGPFLVPDPSLSTRQHCLGSVPHVPALLAKVLLDCLVRSSFGFCQRKVLFCSL